MGQNHQAIKMKRYRKQRRGEPQDDRVISSRERASLGVTSQAPKLHHEEDKKEGMCSPGPKKDLNYEIKLMERVKRKTLKKKEITVSALSLR